MAIARIPTAVVGAGRLARSLVPRLGGAGYPVIAVVARRLASARRVCRGLAGATATTSLSRAVTEARLVLIATPDRTVGPMALRLASLRGIDWNRNVVLHHAGALDLGALAPLADRGAAVGLLHPLQCLGGSPLASRLLAGSRARIDGDRKGLAFARRLARGLGLVPLRTDDLSEAQRLAYHSAASLLSNDLVALLDLGVQMMTHAGIDRDEALGALLPLARGALSQVEHEGWGAGLTGPVVRGDVETLLAQIRRLARLSPDAAEIHRLLSSRLAGLARREGHRLAAGTTRRLRELGSRPRRS